MKASSVFFRPGAPFRQLAPPPAPAKKARACQNQMQPTATHMMADLDPRMP